MNLSCVMLVGPTYEDTLDPKNRDSDDPLFDADDATEEQVVSLMPVRVDWGSRSAPTHPKLRRTEEPLRFILDRRFPEAFWSARHKNAVLVSGTHGPRGWIEITSVIDIDDGHLIRWQ